MGLMRAWLAACCLIAAVSACESRPSVSSYPAYSTDPSAGQKPSVEGLREQVRMPIVTAHHIYDVVSDGQAVVWDQGDDSASEATGGRVLMWQLLGHNEPHTVATATGSQVINDAAVFGDEVFYRIVTQTNGSCDGEAQSCFSWSLWRRTMPDGVATSFAHGAPANRTLIPELVAVGRLGVAYQKPQGDHHEAVLYAPLNGSPTELVSDVVPGSLSADERFVYTQLASGKHCCRLLQLDPRHPDVRLVPSIVPEPATKFFSAYGPSRAAITVERGLLVLHVTTKTLPSSRRLTSDVYDMFWVDAHHLLLYQANGLFIYTPTGPHIAQIAPPADFDVGAAVHAENSVLTFAGPAGNPTTVGIWRSVH